MKVCKMKLFEKIKIEKEREIRIWGLPILQYGTKRITGGNERYIKIFPKSFMKKEFDKIIKLYGGEYDSFVIFRSGLGDLVIILSLINNILTRHKKTIILVHREAHVELINMFYPDVMCIYYPFSAKMFQIFAKCQSCIYKKYHFHVLLERPWLEKILHKNSHIFEDLQEKYNLDFGEITYPNVNQKGISSNKILLAPDAVSVKLIDNLFWDELAKNLKRKGFDVLVNSKEYSLLEVLKFAQESKAIISLRSGLCDLLALYETPMFVLYTQLNKPLLSAEMVLQKYGLSKIHSSKRIKEELFDAEKRSVIISNILNFIEGK